MNYQPCPGKPGIRWMIPARLLNTLWSDLLPRVAAGVWRGDTNDPQWPTSYSSISAAQLESWITWALPHVNDVTVKRLNDLLAFYKSLDKSSKLQPAPLFWVAPGGHDFIISDERIDLFAPRAPENEQHLLTYYRYRRTGRYPVAVPFIGVPHQKDRDLYAHHLLPSPTGPSQLDLHGVDDYGWIRDLSKCTGRDPLMYSLVRRDLVERADAVAAGRSSSEARENLIRTLRVLPDDDAGTWMDVVKAFESGDDAGGVELLTEGLARRHPMEDAILIGGGQLVIGPTFDDYRCCLARKRCWTLLGAVFRGMLEQFPRIMVDRWLQPTSQGGPLLRAELGDRLETSFSPHMLLDFDAAHSYVDEIVVTNLGIHFPHQASLKTTGGGPNALVLKEMLTEIIKGRAGNPVFTDSIVCN